MFPKSSQFYSKIKFGGYFDDQQKEKSRTTRRNLDQSNWEYLSTNSVSSQQIL